MKFKRCKLLIMAKQCYLKNKETGSSINLLDKEEVFLGRNAFTNIRDSFVSKQHVSCTPEFEKYEVAVKWLGANMSGINGYALKKGVTYKLTHGDVIELLLNRLQFEINFDPIPSEFKSNQNNEETTKVPSSPESKTEKRKLSTESHSNSEVDGKVETRPAKVFKTASIFNTSSKDKKCEEYEWKKMYNGDLFQFESRDFRLTEKVAAFDLDGTIITTKSGLVFPKNTNDWQFLYSDIPQKLTNLYETNYQIVFFTNQAGVASGKLKIDDFKQKLATIVARLTIPIKAFISTGKGKFRKPITGMWEEFLKTNNEISIDKTNSFYCGDAAGRPAKWTEKAKKDHSISDRLFARNIDIPFFTPEEYFLKQKSAPFIEPIFNPKTVLNKSLTEPETEKLVSTQLEMLILVGLPASGKSFICQEYLIPAGYIWVNRDTLGTAAKCLSAVEQALREKQKVVIDNTNIDVKSRQAYIQLGKKFKVPVRCAVMNVTVDQCFHNNMFRQLTDSSHSFVATPIMHSFKSKYEEPTLKEGLEKVFKVNFLPKFLNEEQRALYEMYLLEK